MGNSGKFGLKRRPQTSGTLGVFDITNDSQVKIIVENAGPLNMVVVYGKIQGQNSYVTLDTVVGSSTKLIDVGLFDFLDIEVTVYDSLSIYIDIAGSGFENGNGLPAGASTAALQVIGNASLASIDGKTPPLGQTTMANSSPVVIASNQSTIPVSVASLPLPSGGSTAALQTAGNASLTSIDSKLTAPLSVTGPLTDTQLRATPVPVSGTVTANLGTIAGVSTEATLALIKAKTDNIDVLLSTRTKPSDTQTISGSVNATLAAETTKVIGTVRTGIITQGLSYDTINATYNATQDIFTYVLATVTQATITVTYSDSTKTVITSMVRA